MPYLIKKIEGEINEGYSSTINSFGRLKSEIGLEDYIKIGNFESFCQNFSQVVKVEKYFNNSKYGLTNNSEFVELKISY